MITRNEHAAPSSAVLVGPGLAIVGNVVYRLDASLASGESYGAGDIRGEGDDAVLVQHHAVDAAPDVFALLFAPLAAVAGAPGGVLHVTDACALLGVSRTTLDRKIAECSQKNQPARWGGGKGDGARRRWYWPDEAALRAWWARCGGPGLMPQNVPPRPPRTATVADESVVNWREEGQAERRR